MNYKLIFLFILSLISIKAKSQCYLENYPFNKSTSIKLISYSNLDSTYKQWKSTSCIIIPNKDPYDLFNIDYSKLDEIKTLKVIEIAKLAEISFGEKSGCIGHGDGTKDCGEVKKAFAVLFFNENNEVFEEIELCFECNHFASSKGFLLGWMCDEKFELIKNFFIEMEINLTK
jgi:hypothetical protein